MIDLELARRYLVATLPADEPVEIADPTYSMLPSWCW